MSNLMFHIRFGEWHFQIVRWSDWRNWRYQSPIRISRNGYHAKARKTDPDWRWLEWYE